MASKTRDMDNTRQCIRQKLFLLLRQAIAEAERQKSGIQLQDLWVKFQISAHSFSASLPQLYEDRVINEATPWESSGHGARTQTFTVHTADIFRH